MEPSDLVELEAIKRLKYAYMRCVDQKRWDDLAELLTDDVVARYSAGKYAKNGADAVIEWMRSTMDHDAFHSSHRANHPEIEFVSDVEATGTWTLDDTVIDTAQGFTMRGSGFYDDRYRKIDGRWLIAETGYKRTWEDFELRSGGSGPKLTASWWTTGGASKLES